jgi:geranylgeranylglycerol-phosphate geranylgeranyltransferase
MISSARIPVERRSWIDGPAAVVRLVRPLNVVLFVVGVGVGGVLALGGLPREAVAGLLGAAVSAALIGAAANAINDVFDLEIDRLNRPERPLPQGHLGKSGAQWIWIVCSVAGIAVGALVSGTHAAIAIGAVVLLYVYSRRLKRMPVIGNLVVSIVVAAALLYGALAVGEITMAVLVGASFAFLVTLAREIVKDLEDLVGDRSVGARTLAVTAGAGAAGALAIGLMVLTLLLTPLPFLFFGYGSLYLLLVLPACAMLLRGIWVMLGDPSSSDRAARASLFLKGVMVAGLFALVGG